MRLTSRQSERVSAYLRGSGSEPDASLLGLVELRIGLRASVLERLELLNGIVPEFPGGEGTFIFLEVPQTPAISLRIMQEFRDGRYASLLVRVNASWKCHIHCDGGQVHEEVCSETVKDTTNCCEALRGRC
jgi:hypothetical protein